MKERIYFGIFREGRLVTRILGTMPKTHRHVLIAEALCRLMEPAVSEVLIPGDYLAFDYEATR